jgi:histidinol-phosphate aminotransferase
MDQPNQPPPISASLPLRHLRADIRAMAGYTPGEQVSDCVKLNTNECGWPPSPAVARALAALSAEALRTYPDPRSQRLREAAGARYDVNPAQVLVGNGSDDCLTILYRAFLGRGARVACPWPTYGLYDTLATLQGAELVRVDYLRKDGQWRLPGNLALQAAALVVVANPNNPSGTLATVEQLRRLADALDGVLVVDEAYVDFAPEGASMLPYLDRHPNLVVLRTFSKSYSLAGARLGLLFAHAEVVRELMKVKDSYNVNLLSQRLGEAALGDRDHHRELIRKTVAERARVAAALARFGWSWPDTAANFLLCQVGPRAAEIYRQLKARRILVRWWDTPELRECLRISIGRPEWNDALLHALGELVPPAVAR